MVFYKTLAIIQTIDLWEIILFLRFRKFISYFFFNVEYILFQTVDYV